MKVQSGPYADFYRCLLRLHLLNMDGKDRSDEAEDARRETDNLWNYHLTDAQRESMSRLSRILNELDDVTNEMPPSLRLLKRAETHL